MNTSNINFSSIVNSQNMLSYLSQISTSSICSPKASLLVEAYDIDEKEKIN